MYGHIINVLSTWSTEGDRFRDAIPLAAQVAPPSDPSQQDRRHSEREAESATASSGPLQPSGCTSEQVTAVSSTDSTKVNSAGAQSSSTDDFQSETHSSGHEIREAPSSPGMDSSIDMDDSSIIIVGSPTVPSHPRDVHGEATIGISSEEPLGTGVSLMFDTFAKLQTSDVQPGALLAPETTAEPSSRKEKMEFVKKNFIPFTVKCMYMYIAIHVVRSLL